MHKKLVSLSLCLTMVFSAVATCLPASAASVDAEKSTVSKSKVTSADDFSWDNASVYFLLTDRFKNGNTSNDHSYGRATDKNGQPLAGWDTAPGTFHGGDFAGVTQKIKEGYFDDLGVNAIWISAPYEQIHGYISSGNGGFAHYSYHGYYVLDYTETDANFGTKQEFKTLVDTAHEHGIRVVMDIVMNHTGYNTIKDMEEYNFGTLLPGASDYKYMLNNVGGLNDRIDFSSSAADWGNWWGSDWIRSGLPGYSEGGGGDLEMSLTGLPDFRTESTKSVTIPKLLQTKWQKEGTYNQKVSKYGNSDTVSGYLVKWLSEWVSTYGVDGFRCDTAKHVEFASWKKLKTACVSALNTWRANNKGKVGADWDEDFWMTGECWGHKLSYSGYYTEGGFDSMINFSFSGSGVPGISSINGVYQDYANQINTKDDFNALTYISSHDSNLYRGDLYYQGSALQLMPGEIQIYYGDETNRPMVSGLSFDGDGGSGHSLRSDMNWNATNSDLLKHWQKVGQFRNKHIAVGAGAHQQISAYNASTGYTFSRSYDDGEVADGIIAVIGAPANQSIAVNVSSMWSDGVVVTNAYDGTKATVTGGKATFNSGKNGTILIEGPQSTINMTLKGNYSFYDKETLTVSLRGADYAMVSVNGGKAFKVVDGQTFEVGEDLEVGTVFTVTMTATNSEETSNKSFTYKKKDPNAITKIYFDNTKYKWSTVNAYIYEEGSGNAVENAKWPGAAMTYDEATGFYVIEVPEELVNGNVMFNAGNGSANRYPNDGEKGLPINETSMLFAYGNTWEMYDGQVADKPEPPDPTKSITVYFDNSSSNFSNPSIYYWNSSTSSSTLTWPGVAMTKDKDNVWKMTISNENDRCIFSNNGGSQTADLTIPGDGYIYQNNSWSLYSSGSDDTNPTNPTKPSTPSADEKTIYYTNSNNFSTPYIYYWVSSTNSSDVKWPGVAMTKYKDNVWKATIPSKNDRCIFSNNGGSQTADLTIPGTNYIYSNNSWMEYADAEKPSVPTKKILVGDVNVDETIDINDVTFLQQSLAKIEELSEDGTIAADVDKDGYVNIKDATLIQKYISGIDAKESNCGKYYGDTSSEQEPTVQPAKNYIYFKNTNSGWINVTAYYWAGGSNAMISWPGVPMENLGNNVYRIEVPEGAKNIIFNNGSSGNGNQTGDLDIVGYNKIYENGTWSDYAG